MRGGWIGWILQMALSSSSEDDGRWAPDYASDDDEDGWGWFVDPEVLAAV